MSSVTELIPLSGYESSTPADINDKGHVVGMSFDPTQPTWKPQRRATLWAGGQIMYPSKFPPGAEWDLTDFRPTEALRINTQGEVLCVVYGPDDEKKYYLWKNEAESSTDLSAEISGLAWADVNDNRQLVVMLKSGQVRIHDLDVGPSTLLPPLPNLGSSDDAWSSHQDPELIGIDNNGWVVVWWPPKPASSLSSVIARWQPGAPKWSILAGFSAAFEPCLTDTGLLLATRQGIEWPPGLPYYCDLNSTGGPQQMDIPLYSKDPDAYGVYTDANVDGWIVGGEGVGGILTPTLHDSDFTKGQTKSLANHFDPAWQPSYATGVHGKTIIGEGVKAGKTRGWVLNLAKRRPSPFKRKIGYWATINWRSVWLPELDLPYPPIEVLRRLVRELTPDERRRVLSRVRDAENRLKTLESLLGDEGYSGQGH